MASEDAMRNSMKDAIALVQQLEIKYLQELQKVIGDEIAARRKDDVRDAAVEVHKIAARLGMSVEALVRISKKAKPGPTLRPAPPKYRNPKNPEQAWSGRGNAPKWVAEYAAANNDDLTGILINKAA